MLRTQFAGAVGALLGAAAGFAIGHVVKRPVVGTACGAALGTWAADRFVNVAFPQQWLDRPI